VAQVVGAGYGVSKETGDTATIVKLFRVALLLPTIVVVALMFRSKMTVGPSGKRPPLVPMFLLGFVALVAVNSSGVVTPSIMEATGDASRWCLVTAIAALGAKTSLGELVYVGWKPVLLIVAETAVVLGWVLAMLLLG
jgi:uncharacterized membrane protein YadS